MMRLAMAKRSGWAVAGFGRRLLRRFRRGRWPHWFLVLSAALLMLMPGGSAVCWPLLAGGSTRFDTADPLNMVVDCVTDIQAALADAPPASFSSPQEPGSVPVPSHFLPFWAWFGFTPGLAALLWQRLGDQVYPIYSGAFPPEPPPPRCAYSLFNLQSAVS